MPPYQNAVHEWNNYKPRQSANLEYHGIITAISRRLRRRQIQAHRDGGITLLRRQNANVCYCQLAFIIFAWPASWRPTGWRIEAGVMYYQPINWSMSYRHIENGNGRSWRRWNRHNSGRYGIILPMKFRWVRSRSQLASSVSIRLAYFDFGFDCLRGRLLRCYWIGEPPPYRFWTALNITINETAGGIVYSELKLTRWRHFHPAASRPDDTADAGNEWRGT